jgi:hypothetical protein
MAVLGILGCGGVSERTPEATGGTGSGGDAGEGAHSGTTGGLGRGGASSRGGTGNVTGGTGNATQGGTGTGGHGGTPPRGGASGGGVGGAGQGAAGGAGQGAAGAESCFEPLPLGARCENAGSRVQDATSVRVEGADRLEDCERACVARADCTAVTDYFAEPGLSACYLRHVECGDVGTPVWAEEDAGKEYVKVCDEKGRCALAYLGHFRRCESAMVTELATATSRADCDAACLADPTCTGVTDFFWLNEIPGCYLYTSTCESPTGLPFGDPGQTYRKVPCE